MPWRYVEYHGDRPSEFVEVKSHDVPYPRDWFTVRDGDSIEAIKKSEGMPDEPCRCCGSCFRTNYVDECKKKLLELNICFTCLHWREIIEGQNDRCLTIDGDHYMAQPENGGPPYGHGGRAFGIEMLKDGRRFVARNLWHQGKIPLRFRDRLPDNAKFIEL